MGTYVLTIVEQWFERTYPRNGKDVHVGGPEELDTDRPDRDRDSIWTEDLRSVVNSYPRSRETGLARLIDE